MKELIKFTSSGFLSMVFFPGPSSMPVMSLPPLALLLLLLLLGMTRRLILPDPVMTTLDDPSNLTPPPPPPELPCSPSSSWSSLARWNPALISPSSSRSYCTMVGCRRM